jgi:ACS family D-galactonate transporter-like MFS transporter
VIALSGPCILIGLIAQIGGSYFLVLIFFVIMAMLLAIFSEPISNRF